MNNYETTVQDVDELLVKLTAEQDIAELTGDTFEVERIGLLIDQALEVRLGLSR